MAGESSSEPVSTTTMSSTTGRIDSRQAARKAASFLTMSEAPKGTAYHHLTLR
jgi:hypothetical protein